MLEIWLVIVGSLIHSLYPLTGEHLIIGLFTPINESVWEHFKLGYTSMLVWIPLSRRWFRYRNPNIWMPTITGVFVITFTVIAIFFLIRPLFNDHALVLAVDISSYVIGSVLAGVVIRRWTSTPLRTLEKLGVLLWILIGLVFIGCTLFPPALPIFIEKGL